jgi:hypothetical protein
VTGALYAIRRELFPVLPEGLILDDLAVPMVVVGSGYRVLFEPASSAYDQAAPQAGEFRRKVRTLAGNLQLVWLQPWLLNPLRNRLWWQFVSHKLLRLAVPWALIGVFGASLVLGVHVQTPHPVYSVVAVGQIVFYAAALAGIALESRGRRFRVLSLAAAFVLLNAAAVVALLQFMSGRSSVAWKTGVIGSSRGRDRRVP